MSGYCLLSCPHRPDILPKVYLIFIPSYLMSAERVKEMLGWGQQKSGIGSGTKKKQLEEHVATN